MKTITRILMLFTVVLFGACLGEEGPMGPSGEDGINIVGTVYEINGNFTSANDYSLYYKFPQNLVDGDIVMVYVLWEQVSNGKGGMLDVWRALPQTTFLSGGALQYNFDYTVGDVKVYLDGDIDRTTLPSADTNNQIFRIAVIPADLAINKSIDLNNLSAVMGSMKLSPGQIKNVSAVAPTLTK